MNCREKNGGRGRVGDHLHSSGTPCILHSSGRGGHGRVHVLLAHWPKSGIGVVTPSTLSLGLGVCLQKSRKNWTYLKKKKNGSEVVPITNLELSGRQPGRD